MFVCRNEVSVQDEFIFSPASSPVVIEEVMQVTCNYAFVTRGSDCNRILTFKSTAHKSAYLQAAASDLTPLSRASSVQKRFFFLLLSVVVL